MLGDDLYIKLGRMTVEFGGLDFFVGLLAGHMAERLNESPVRVFTAQQLEQIKEWAKSHAAALGDDLVRDVSSFCGDAKGLLRRRHEGIHGLWLSDHPDEGQSFVLKLRAGDTMGYRSETTSETIVLLTAEATAMANRASALTVQFLKLFG